ncbi:MAG: 50S ribosomal protein L30e [archaeon]
MKIERAIKEIIRTGKITYGTKETKKSIEEGKAEIVIIAENTPRKIKEEIKEKTQEKNIPLKIYPGTSLELGETCRRPHLTTAMTVEDTGTINEKEIE